MLTATFDAFFICALFLLSCSSCIVEGAIYVFWSSVKNCQVEERKEARIAAWLERVRINGWFRQKAWLHWGHLHTHTIIFLLWIIQHFFFSSKSHYFFFQSNDKLKIQRIHQCRKCRRSKYFIHLKCSTFYSRNYYYCQIGCFLRFWQSCFRTLFQGFFHSL